MQKKKIAVLFGGKSVEYQISLQSACAVLENIDKTRYDIVPIGITKEGEWFYYTGAYQNIANNTWLKDSENLFPCRSIREIDLAFPVLHGKNGEDGTVQGVFELAGIPLIGCNTLSSALCMDKDRAHKLVSLAGIAVPRSVTFKKSGIQTALSEIASNLAYPLFVKPVRSGSSFGISKVAAKQALEKAIQTAFRYDTEVIAEQAIDGFEVGCAILGTDALTVGRVD